MSGGTGLWIAVRGVRALPVNALSRLAGRIARARLPGPLLRACIHAFVRVFGVDLREARDPVASFRTFQDFFTRRLREGARPVDPGPDAFVAPCDGAWGAAGRIEGGTLLQLKGRPYSLAGLLGSEEDARRFEGGAFATFYLAPRDYHRFHAPCDAAVDSARLLPGRLWPVNRIGLEGFEGLFAQNERICAFLRPTPGREEPEGPRQGGAPLCLVAVGATMVGCVRVTFDSLTTNVPGASAELRRYEPSPRLLRGQEWGRFEFGSTIVMLAAPGLLALDTQLPGTPLRCGACIGRFAASA
jgi:phosphatidylserine decarboxylase